MTDANKCLLSVVAGALFAFLVTEASANSICTQIGNATYCRDTPSPQPNGNVPWQILNQSQFDLPRVTREAQEYRAERNAQRRMEAERSQAASRADMRRQIAKQALSGDCWAAEGNALASGDLELATAVQGFCGAER